MIEARSCERFRMLSERIADDDLKTFYHELMVSEAQHYPPSSASPASRAASRWMPAGRNSSPTKPRSSSATARKKPCTADSACVPNN